MAKKFIIDKKLEVPATLKANTLYFTPLQGTENQIPLFDAFLTDETGSASHLLMPKIIADNFVLCGYAGMEDEAGTFSIGAGWSAITSYTANTVEDFEVFTDLAAGTMQFKYVGVYRMAVFINLIGHDSSNQGRTINVRFFNVTDGTAVGDPFVVGIGRNQEDTIISFSFLVEIDSSNTGDAVRLEIGGGDTVIGFSSTVIWDVNQVSNASAFIQVPQPPVFPIAAFDGTGNQYVLSAATMPRPVFPVAMVARIKTPATFSSVDNIFSWSINDNVNNYIRMFIEPNGNDPFLRSRIRQGGTTVDNDWATGNLAPSTEYLITWVVVSTTVQNVWINKVLQTQTVTNTVPQPATGTYHIAAGKLVHSSAVGQYTGNLGDFNAFNRQLTQTDVDELNDNLTSFPASGPPEVLSWAINEGSGTTASDSSGNSNNGVITGDPWAANETTANNPGRS